MDTEGAAQELREELKGLAEGGLIDATTDQEALMQLLNGAMNQAALWVAHAPERDAALTAATGYVGTVVGRTQALERARKFAFSSVLRPNSRITSCTVYWLRSRFE